MTESEISSAPHGPGPARAGACGALEISDSVIRSDHFEPGATGATLVFRLRDCSSLSTSALRLACSKVSLRSACAKLRRACDATACGCSRRRVLVEKQ